MNTWRINLKPASSDNVDPRKFCIKKNIIGVGWAVSNKETLDWETYVKLGTKIYYNNGDNGWWPAIRAIGERIEINDLIWTSSFLKNPVRKRN